jgi:hypothetical protein
MTGWSMGAIGAIFNSIMIWQKIAALFIFAPQADLGDLNLERQWGTYQTNLLTNEGYRRNERLNANYLVYAHRLNSLPVMFTFCGKNDVNVGWQEKIAFYDSLKTNRQGAFHFWSMTDHVQVFYNSPWQPSFSNFSFFTRYRTNLSYPAFTNCSINDNPGNGTPSNGDPIGSINGHVDWNDNIVDLASRWEITLRLKDLSTTFGADVAPDSATTDLTLRRLQAFSVPLGYTINWENRRNNVVVQQGFFTYNSGLITIPGVKVYKDSSRLTVTFTPVSVAEQNVLPREYALSQNYPNPFNPNTTIEYAVPKRSNVRLEVFNILGQSVRTLVDELKPAGEYKVVWDTRDNRGQLVSIGVYLYRLRVGGIVLSKKMLLLR